MYKVIAFCKWCQDLPPAQLARNLKGLGFDGVDLPCRPGAPVTHATAPQKLSDYQRAFADEGLTLDRLVTSLQEADDEADRLLATAAELGIGKIRISGHLRPKIELGGKCDMQAALDQARRGVESLEKLLAKHGVSGGIQNHSGITLSVNVSSLLRVLEGRDPQWVGIQYDPGHTAFTGESPRLALGLMGPYLHSVNFKSSRYMNAMDPQTGRLRYHEVWGPLRDGMIDVPDVLAELQAAGYEDPISIHGEHRTYFYRVEEDREATDKLVGEDVAYLRACMDAAG